MKLGRSAKRPCRLERGEICRIPQDRTNLLVRLEEVADVRRFH